MIVHKHLAFGSWVLWGGGEMKGVLLLSSWSMDSCINYLDFMFIYLFRMRYVMRYVRYFITNHMQHQRAHRFQKLVA